MVHSREQSTLRLTLLVSGGDRTYRSTRPAKHGITVLDAERTPVQRLTKQVVASLQAGAPALAARWRTDSIRVAPGAPVLDEGTPHSAEIVRALDALARGIAGDSCWQDDLIRAGWALGVRHPNLPGCRPAGLGRPSAGPGAGVSGRSRPVRAHSACTSLRVTPTPARFLSGYVQSWRLGFTTANARGNSRSGSW